MLLIYCIFFVFVFGFFFMSCISLRKVLHSQEDVHMLTLPHSAVSFASISLYDSLLDGEDEKFVNLSRIFCQNLDCFDSSCWWSKSRRVSDKKFSDNRFSIVNTGLAVICSLTLISETIHFVRVLYTSCTSCITSHSLYCSCYKSCRYSRTKMTWSLFLSAPYALFTYQWLSEATQAFSEELSSIFSYFPIAWMVLNTENMLIFCASCSGIHNVRRTMIK